MNARLITFLLLLLPSLALAHKSSDSYLYLQPHDTETLLRWDIALQDIQQVISLDQDGDGQLRWDEIQQRQRDIFSYASSNLSITTGLEACTLAAESLQISQRGDGAYAVLWLTPTCPSPLHAQTSLWKYTLFSELDAQHRGIFINQSQSSDHPPQIFKPGNIYEVTNDQQPLLKLVINYVKEGVWHIWIGYDHILFLLTLLLPFLFWKGLDLTAQGKNLFWVISAFTVAHSITLSLAMTGWVSLPGKWVETAIAMSVIAAAISNFRKPSIKLHGSLAFGFGLIHGFGFANVLTELGLGTQALVTALLSFNLGVELGQLMIVFAILPLAYLLRYGISSYQRIIPIGSSLAILVGAFWVWERI